MTTLIHCLMEISKEMSSHLTSGSCFVSRAHYSTGRTRKYKGTMGKKINISTNSSGAQEKIKIKKTFKMKGEIH